MEEEKAGRGVKREGVQKRRKRSDGGKQVARKQEMHKEKLLVKSMRIGLERRQQKLGTKKKRIRMASWHEIMNENRA